MKAFRFLTRGLGRSLRHPYLILACYAVTLIPAVAVGIGASFGLTDTLSHRVLGDRLLDGRGLEVALELLGQPGDAPSAVVGGAMMMLILILPAQLLLAAVICHSLLGTGRPVTSPTAKMIVRTWWRFLRLAAWLGLIVAGVLVIAGAISGQLADLATAHRDGRLDILGALLAALLLLVTIPLIDLAHDLTRLASARHDDASTGRGLLRALWLVIRHPILLGPLAAATIIIPALLYLLFFLIRAPWTASTGIGIVLLVILQQTFMLGRAVSRVWLWAAAVEAYRHLGEPRLCRGRRSGAELPAEPPPVEQPEILFIEPSTSGGTEA